MSRILNGTSDFLTTTSLLGVSGYPLTIFTKFKASTFATNNRNLSGFYDDFGAAVVKTAILTSSPTGGIELIAFDGTNYNVTATSATASTGAWQSSAGVWASTTSRSVYLNGTNKVTTTSTDAVNFGIIDRFSVGAFGNAVGEFFAGNMGMVAVWSVALSDSEIAQLHQGALPTAVQGASLRAWWNMKSNASPETDGSGNGFNLTVTGTTFSTDDPAVATLSSPTPVGTLATSTTATIGATTDQTAGTFYVVVDSAANLAGVTSAQIKAGQKASGAAALAAANSSVTTTTPSAGVTGLSAGTLYSYSALEFNANGDSNIVSGTFTTLATTVLLGQISM